MLLNPVKLTGREGPQFAGDVAVTFGQGHDRAAPHHADDGLTNCLGGKLMHLADLEAENIAGQVERTDLAAAIARIL